MNRKSIIELTNMCLIRDGNRVLVEEKLLPGGKTGLVFPGGHVEEGESLRDSVVREMWEETGLTIENPVLCGCKNWICEDGTRYLVLLYRATRFHGDLRCSEEGRVFWVDWEQLDTLPLIWNTRELLAIFDSDDYSEFFSFSENGVWHEMLL